jgi:threonine dehydrogenase-like Zn-dependent dehydrogenase
LKAVCWYGKQDVRVEDVPDPTLLNPRDAIIKVSTTAICGSDLHLYDGFIPTMKKGDILGHEFVGKVIQLGSGVKNLNLDDRVVVPFTIACGNCYFCQSEMWSLCDNSNPNAWMAEALYGSSPSGLFGYSHLLGGYAGGQAEYVRVPFADVGPMKIPDHISDEAALSLADILPTAYQAVEQCEIQPGDVIAVWGCGPVGQLIIQCAYLLGAGRVIAIDRIPERIQMANQVGNAEVINFQGIDVVETLKEMTGGRGPDVCIDAVGLEAHGLGIDALYDRVKHALLLTTDLAHVLRQAIQACRKGGTVSIPGVYAGFLDKVPLGAAFGKGLKFQMGQTHVHKFLRPLLERIDKGELKPNFVLTHKFKLEEAPIGYQFFKQKQDGCVKVALEV